MSSVLESNSQLQDHLLKSRSLVFECSVTHHATPASKVHHVDVPGVVMLRTKGKVAEVDAIEDLSALAATAVDATNCQFVIFITDLGSIDKVSKVSVIDKKGTGSGMVVVDLDGSGSIDGFLTAGGNIAIDVTGTGIDLETEDPTFVVKVDYSVS